MEKVFLLLSLHETNYLNRLDSDENDSGSVQMQLCLPLHEMLQ